MMTFVRFEILQMVNRLAFVRSVEGCSLYSSKRINLPILASDTLTTAVHRSAQGVVVRPVLVKKCESNV